MNQKRSTVIFPSQPSADDIREALKYPNGYVYHIDGDFGPNDDVPPERILGAWKVDGEGRITGAFIPNENFVPRDGFRYDG